MSLAFVYGTLLPGFGNHVVMQRGRGTFVCDAVLHDYEMFSFGYFPGIRKAEGEQVHGQVWDVEDLAPLDRLEGHPNFYLRTPVVVLTPAKSGGHVSIDVETYVPTGDNSMYGKVEGGRWRRE